MIKNRLLKQLSVFFLLFALFVTSSNAQESVAMRWNKVQLACIRKDMARPTVQARNLYHSSLMMYDLWAVYDDDANTAFLGKTWGDFTCEFNGVPIPDDVQAAREEAISYAMYRFITNRYQPFAPTPQGQPFNNWITFMSGYVEELMDELGYDASITSIDYSDGDPAKLGNYIAFKMQQYGLQDGSNQGNNYANLYYQPVNGNLFAEEEGNPLQYDGNRWQPLSLTTALDQNGLPVPNGLPALSAEWGRVTPFSMTEDMATTLQRDGHDWKVYLDPGAPPMLDTTTVVETQWEDDFFRWGMAVVSIWHSLHDTNDGVMKDISPNNIGNVDEDTFPTTFEEFKNFYNVFEGGDPGIGYDINPITNLPYEENLVPRSDYTRVLAEYWADGPNSETPPGHWFVNINNIAQHPLFEKRWEGQGEILDDLEWDVRAYLALGGGLHDVAVACWGAKGFYDNTRPIMAIRYMIDHGQCSDMNLANYDPAGIPLIPGYIEVIEAGDPLAGANDEHVGKIKLYTFRGPVEATGLDGVGWIRGENWWTFQRRTFVTPPFPGFYSGHSTYSRAAAEILERITGSEYYPGGMGEFYAQQGVFLAASPGPSVDVTMQWAKYKDAADQCSLSRIYGGLHPPQDDIPGRQIARTIGPLAYDKALTYMSGTPHLVSLTSDKQLITDADVGTNVIITAEFSQPMDSQIVPALSFLNEDPTIASLAFISDEWIDATHYAATYLILDGNDVLNDVTAKVVNATGESGNIVFPTYQWLFDVETKNPIVDFSIASETMINDATTQNGQLTVEFTFNEPMDINIIPEVVFPLNEVNGSLSTDSDNSGWQNENTFLVTLNMVDNNATFEDVDIQLQGATDLVGNPQTTYLNDNLLDIDTENPHALAVQASQPFINTTAFGQTITIQAQFNEEMNPSQDPTLTFTNDDPSNTLSFVSGAWIDELTYAWTFDVLNSDEELNNITANISLGLDLADNSAIGYSQDQAFGIDTHAPSIVSFTANTYDLSDQNVSPSALNFLVEFDDEMNPEEVPVFTINQNIDGSVVLNEDLSEWMDEFTFSAVFELIDANIEVNGVEVTVSNGLDVGGNPLTGSVSSDETFSIDTKNPSVLAILPNYATVTDDQLGPNQFSLMVIYDEPMDQNVNPAVSFPVEDPQGSLSLNTFWSGWVNATTYKAAYNVADLPVYQQNIDVAIINGKDAKGNIQNDGAQANVFSVELTVGIEETEDLSASIVYPNPVRSGADLMLTLPVIPQDLSISIIDTHGKIVMTPAVNNLNGNNLRINTAGLSAGAYFVKLSSANGNASFQFAVLN